MNGPIFNVIAGTPYLMSIRAKTVQLHLVYPLIYFLF